MEDRTKTKHHICMIVQDPTVHGGIAAVTAGYYGSRLEQDFRVTYVESYCDGSRWTKLKKALKAYREFRKVLKEDPPELIHIHASFGPSFYREIPFILWSARRGIPVINHIHGSAFDEFYSDASRGKQKLVRCIYGKCARLIVLSEHWKKVLSAVVPAEKIVVIPNYSVLHPEVMTEQAMQARFAGRQVLYLGVLTEGKGMKEMPEIIRRTARAVPDVKFVLAGSGDASLITEGLMDQSQPTDGTTGEENNNLVLPGWVSGEEKASLLRNSMIFLLPSHMEAMPMSILEAMGYGLPVVATEVGGIPNLVVSDVTGMLCPVGDAAAMAGALIRYLTNETLWAETSRQAMERADRSFSFERHLDRLEKVYREVLDESGK